MKTIVQCDFDGTVTIEDVSYMLLDDFAGDNWRDSLEHYQKGEITVGQFNSEAFGMIKADEKSLLDSIKGRIRVRNGFRELVDCCQLKDYRFAIVSNGLTFYIKQVLQDVDHGGIEVFAADAVFDPRGMRVQYVGPDGTTLDSDFKLAYVRFFQQAGYRVLYIGNGSSDVPPAIHSDYIFATDDLLERCQCTGQSCTAFGDFRDVVKVLETM